MSGGGGGAACSNQAALGSDIHSAAAAATTVQGRARWRRRRRQQGGVRGAASLTAQRMDPRNHAARRRRCLNDYTRSLLPPHLVSMASDDRAALRSQTPRVRASLFRARRRRWQFMDENPLWRWRRREEGSGVIPGAGLVWMPARIKVCLALFVVCLAVRDRECYGACGLRLSSWPTLLFSMLYFSRVPLSHT